MGWVNVFTHMESVDASITGAASVNYWDSLTIEGYAPPFETGPIVELDYGCGPNTYIYYVEANDTVDDWGFGPTPYTAPDNVVLLSNAGPYDGRTATRTIALPYAALSDVKRIRARAFLRGTYSEENYYGALIYVSYSNDLSAQSPHVNETIGTIEHPSSFDNDTFTQWFEFDVESFPDEDHYLVFMVPMYGCSGSFGPFALQIEIEQLDELLAVDDEATTPHATPVTLDILANDTLNGEPVQLSDLAGPPEIVTPPSIGSAVANPDGTITYTPPEGFTGEVEFQYRIATPGPEECPELWFTNNMLWVDDLEEAIGPIDASNIYFQGPDEEYYYFTAFNGRFEPEEKYLPCLPEGTPYPWEVWLYWGDGSGDVCVRINHGCS